MKKEKLIPGDIFSLKLKDFDKYIFGQILFDVEKQYYNLSVEQGEESYFDVYDECQLIRMYKGIYETPLTPDNLEILINSAFIYNIDSKSNRLKWNKVGHLSLEPQIIEFPEMIGEVYGNVQLMRGELHFMTPYENIDDFEINWSAEYPEVLANECVYLQNRKDLISGQHYSDSFKEMDLRNFPELRNKIYADLGIDPNKSYYELSKEMGFDLERFY